MGASRKKETALVSFDTEIESCIKKLSKEPIYFDREEDCQSILNMRMSGMPKAFSEVLSFFPELILDSPANHSKTLSVKSTSSKLVVECGLDGRFAALAAACGQWANILHSDENKKLGTIMQIKSGFRKWVTEYDVISTIGVGLLAIHEKELNLWPLETEKMQQEELASFFLRLRCISTPGAMLFIQGEDCISSPEKIVLAARGGGWVVVNPIVPVGGLILTLSTVHLAQPQKPLWSTPLFVEGVQNTGLQGLERWCRNILESTPQRGVATCLRMAKSRIQKLLTYDEFSAMVSKSRRRVPGRFGSPGENGETTLPPVLAMTLSNGAFASIGTGFLPTPSSSRPTPKNGSRQPRPPKAGATSAK